MIAATGLTPLHVVVPSVETLPRLASGKIDYAAVKEFRAAEEPKRNESVVEAFRRAFYPRRVAPSDSFGSLGGDSLLYVQLSLELERTLGRTPDGWESMSVSELARLSRNDGRSAVDSDIILRAVAILLVVVHHATLWPIPGGAAMLVMLVGFGIARFQAASLIAGRPGRMLRSLAQNLCVYLPILAGFALVRGEIPWASVFLVGNLGLADPTRMLPYLYWFVEAYAQIVLIWAGLFAWKPVRHWAEAEPFGFGLLLLFATVAAKQAAPLVWNVGPAQIFTVTDVLYLAVLGWCVHFARSARARLGLLIIAALLFPLLAYMGGNWTGSWVKFSMLLAATAILLYLPRLRLPRPLRPDRAAGSGRELSHLSVPPHPARLAAAAAGSGDRSAVAGGDRGGQRCCGRDGCLCLAEGGPRYVCTSPRGARPQHSAAGRLRSAVAALDPRAPATVDAFRTARRGLASHPLASIPARVFPDTMAVCARRIWMTRWTNCQLPTRFLKLFSAR